MSYVNQLWFSGIAPFYYMYHCQLSRFWVMDVIGIKALQLKKVGEFQKHHLAPLPIISSE